MNAAGLDGVTVAARALGWDGAESDGTEWSLVREDLPQLTTLIGTLTVNRVEELDYTQFVVNGIPVDPGSITEVDYGGWEVIVASFDPNQPRDEEGKWTSTGGSVLEQWSESEGKPFDAAEYKAALLDAATNPHAVPPPGYDSWGPGMKAAWKKKKNLASVTPTAAGTAPTAASLTTHMATEALKHSLEAVTNPTGLPVEIPNDYLLDNADKATVMAYAQLHMSKSQLAKLGTHPTEEILRADAKKLANQHRTNVAGLEELGYFPGHPVIASEAARAMMRETGERKPTGGPGTANQTGGWEHVTYTPDAIDGLPREKQEAILIHHSGGMMTPQQVAGMSALEVREGAKKANAQYGKTVMELKGIIAENGGDENLIPHSLVTAKAFLDGQSAGLTMPPGYVTPPPKPKPVAAPKAAPVAPAQPSGVPTPPGWHNLTAEQKKSAKVKPSDLAPKPAEWHSWNAAKKAAWSKKYNLAVTGVYTGPATTSPSPIGGQPAGTTTTVLGQHVIHSNYTSLESVTTANVKAINKMDKEREAAGIHWDQSAHNARIYGVSGKLTSAQNSAWESYKGGGYQDINGCAKYGTGCTQHVQSQIKRLEEVFKIAATPAPKVLYRGKARSKSGPIPDLKFEVGHEFTEPGFGSWSGDTGTPKNFANSGSKSQRTSVIYRIKDTKGIKSIPGTSGEHETITPRGVKYRVVAIQDFISAHPTQPGKNVHHRIMDLEIIN